jgi:hypothetical protein
MNAETKKRIEALSEEIAEKTAMVRDIARDDSFSIRRIIDLCAEIDRAINEFALLKAIDEVEAEDREIGMN